MVAIKTAREYAEDYRESRLRIGRVNEFSSIFKYVSLDGPKSWNYFEKMCAEHKLYGATLNSLNDPLEGKARLFNDLTDEKISECCWYYDASESICNAMNDGHFPGFWEVPRLVDEKMEVTLSSVRILSFCRRVDSHLLWSHYARSHQGACVHFNLSAFTERRLIAGDVRYSIYRPVIPKSLLARLAITDEEKQHPKDRRRLRAELYEALFFTKPNDWSYEEETRIIYLTSDMTNVPFNPAGLFEVVLGAKVDRDTEDRVRSLMTEHLPHVAVRKAILNEDTFSVGIE